MHHLFSVCYIMILSGFHTGFFVGGGGGNVSYLALYILNLILGGGGTGH